MTARRMTQGEYEALIDGKIKQLMNVSPDTGQECLSIKASIHILNVLKSKDLSWLKQHSAELSGLSNYWILNMTWDQALQDTLGLELRNW